MGSGDEQSGAGAGARLKGGLRNTFEEKRGIINPALRRARMPRLMEGFDTLGSHDEAILIFTFWWREFGHTPALQARVVV